MIAPGDGVARVLALRAELTARPEWRQTVSGGGFGAHLDGAMKTVNGAQAEAAALSAAYERGDTADLASVVVARQKSSLAFQATLQVRNKLLSAYRDIMNMPV